MDNQPDKKETDNKKKPIRLIKKLFLLILLVIVVVFVLIYLGFVKSPSTSIPTLQKKVEVKLKTEYKNPFTKETQYVNPFDKYKNPFVTK